MKKIIYKCLNRHCRTEVSKPGRCDTCAATWENTVRVARAAYFEDEEDEDEDEEDDMYYYSSYDDQEDFGADLGISCSDPIEYYD